MKKIKKAEQNMIDLCQLILHHKTDDEILHAIKELKISSKNVNYIYQEYNGNTALYLCAVRGHEKSIKKLLELKADPNIANWVGSIPIVWPFQDGHINIIKDLIQYGVEIESNKKKIIECAIQSSKKESCIFCLDLLKTMDDIEYFKKILIENRDIYAKKAVKSYLDDYKEIENKTNEKIIELRMLKMEDELSIKDKDEKRNKL